MKNRGKIVLIIFAIFFIFGTVLTYLIHINREEENFDENMLIYGPHQNINDNSSKYSISSETKESEDVLKIINYSVTEIGRGTLKSQIELSNEDADTLKQIMNNGQWIEETSDCSVDCVINIKGNWVYYHSVCGTFSKYILPDNPYISSRSQDIKGKFLTLNDEEMEVVNNILRKYITLNIDIK